MHQNVGKERVILGREGKGITYKKTKIVVKGFVVNPRKRKVIG